MFHGTPCIINIFYIFIYTYFILKEQINIIFLLLKTLKMTEQIFFAFGDIPIQAHPKSFMVARGFGRSCVRVRGFIQKFVSGRGGAEHHSPPPLCLHPRTIVRVCILSRMMLSHTKLKFPQ